MLNVELSNIWSCVSLPDLLSREKELFDAHLHLRSNQPGFAQYLGWLGQSDALTARMLHAVRTAEKAIRAAGDTLVVLGTASACHAAQAALALLGDRGKGRMRVFFAGDSLSSRSWLELCDRLEGHDFCLHIVSPLGGEMETAIASRAVRWMMERRYGAETKTRIYVSAQPNTPVALMAKEEGYAFLPVPTQPGGAYSALTSATLLPLAVAGIEPLEVLEGAAEAYRQYDLRAFENPVWMYAGARYALYGRGRTAELLGTFDPAFSAFGTWWAQWVCRHACQSGAGVLPLPMCLTRDLDAVDNMLTSGRYPLFETMLHVPPLSAQRVNVEMDWKDYDGLDYLADKSVADVAAATYQAMLDTHAAADVPVIVIEGETLDAAHLGELFYFFELANAIFACACGVDPFDLPKELPTRRAAAELLGRPEKAE